MRAPRARRPALDRRDRLGEPERCAEPPLTERAAGSDRYLPCQTGGRFSANAVAPSRASSEAKIGSQIGAWRSNASLCGQSSDSRRMRLLPASASGPLAAIVAASSSAASSAAALLGHAVDEPELVAALGGDRIAGQRQLVGDVARQHARQSQQPAAGGDERALDLGDAELGAARRRRSDRRRARSRARRPRRSPRSRRSAACRTTRSVMPAKPRPSTHGISPAAKALRSMPAQKKPPAPVTIPTDSDGVGVELRRALRRCHCATAALTALRWSGRLRVITRTRSRRSVRTAA